MSTRNKIAALVLFGALAAAPAAAATAAVPAGGTPLSVALATQGNFGKLSIGLRAVENGPYLDAKEVRREGLHAGLSITVAGDSSAFQQPSVIEGQVLEIAGYRLRVEKINPGAKGSVVFLVWDAPKPARRWPFSLFGR